jgi:putative membrane protein
MQGFKRYGSVLALGAVCALGACGKSDNAADSAAAPATATMPDSGAGMTATPADSASAASAAGAPAAGAMSNANVASLIGLTNASEIGAAKVAQDKATNADVKAYAKQMIAEHQAMQKSLDSLTAAMKVTPQAPAAADQKKQAGDQMLATLESTAKGAAFDKAYIDGQVQAHQQALSDLQGFSANAPDPQLKSLIDAAIPKVQAHLDKAQQLQSKLAGS